MTNHALLAEVLTKAWAFHRYYLFDGCAVWLIYNVLNQI